ncbi:MAG: type II toxin-antitoxin system HicB family antitoxin [Thermodesulfobacteriota bacterium]
MKTYTYTVLLAPKADGGYRVKCPALPGVRAYGETRKEAIQNIRISISHKLDTLIANGRRIPEDGDCAHGAGR